MPLIGHWSGRSGGQSGGQSAARGLALRLVFAAVIALLSACGQKGPLYLPGAANGATTTVPTQNAAQQPVAPSSATPSSAPSTK